MGVVLLLALVLSACGGGSSSTSAGSEPTSEEPATSETEPASAEEPAEGEGGESAATIAYDGPEKGLPVEYPEPAKSGNECKIGYQNIYSAIPAMSEQQKGAEKEAQNLGCDLVTLDDELDLTTQVNNFNQLLSQNVGDVIVFPLVPKSLGPSVGEANSKNVPVVSNSSPPAATEPLPKGYATRILQGFDEGAYLRAKYVAEEHPGAEFAVMGLAQPVASLQYFSQRAKYWGERFGLKYAGEVDAQEDNPASASQAMSALLGKYPDVEALFTYSDNSAVAAGLVAKTSQREVAICGNNAQTDAVKAIEDGTMACTIYANFQDMGAQLVRAAYDLAEGQKLPETAKAELTLVTKENASEIEPIG
jgi:ABC-type sugar transport system substrate-binding protein